jgi:hypothetical protein
MIKTLFMGACDFSDFLQYTSKLLSLTGKKVLLVDATEERYIYYGTPNPGVGLEVLEHEGFDVAGHFESMESLENYMSADNYDHLIVHCHSTTFLKKPDISKFNLRYVVTTNERISLEKTVYMFKQLFSESVDDKTITSFTKIFANNVASDLSDTYLETVLSGLPITWSEGSLELLFDEVDYVTKINNQHNGKIELRRLSKYFRKTLFTVIEEISQLDTKEIKLAFKQVKRRTLAWGK